MKFSDLILESRLILHDARKPNGSWITDASEDGIRWTSQQLITLAKGALAEMLRTFVHYKIENHLLENIQVKVLTGVLEVGAGFSKVSWAETYAKYKIISIQEAANTSNIYSYVTPQEFFSKRFRNSSEVVRKVFTMLNEENSLVTAVLPATEDSLAVQGIAYVSIDDLYTITSTVELPFVNCDDLILDYVEKQARRREANLDMYKFINDTITLKIKELVNEASRNN